MDIWTDEKRSYVMSRIRSRDTKPEKKVRSLLHKMGYRFRIHVKNLPGCPDVVLPKYRKVIFVHGCFWHLHKDCRDGTLPKSEHEKWKNKLERNVERDLAQIKELRKEGWMPLVIWECEIEKSIAAIERKLAKFIKL